MAKIPYKTSKDYERLKQLLDEGLHLVAEVKDCCQPVVVEIYKGNVKWPGWKHGARYGFIGFEICRTFRDDTFIKDCERYELEFVEPSL